MRWCFLMLVLFGCAKEENTEIKYPERLPLTEQSKELSSLPPYQGPSEGKAVGISEGEEAPYDGLLLDEDKGVAAAKLRISYDELYSLSVANNKYFLTIIEVQGRELYRADEVLKRKEKQIDKLQNSWWQQNKLWVGVGTGLLAGILVCLATERLVLEVKEASDSP